MVRCENRWRLNVYLDYRQTGWSTHADLVQSRFSQTGPRSVSELESVLILPFNLHSVLGGRNYHGSECSRLCGRCEVVQLAFSEGSH